MSDLWTCLFIMFKVGLATPIATVVGIVICVVYLKLSKWDKDLESVGRHD
ncbi:hypothetical protein J0B03_05165 [Alkalibacter rhizosphaerae]|uniref:Uncharacterized protein n=1 Tax=Alkalibacter rhizosphaerae TaxID=2815577 RepID=A0A974XIR2_9FIRM|nr:hypothetical protein [Alkalibacter rhizosphaerae]QSX09455.1 hypothetical protein J0B03_05165 [Alkalibacter rhizosphaerae]